MTDISRKLVEESNHPSGIIAELLEGAASEIDLLRDEKADLVAELGRVRAENERLTLSCFWKHEQQCALCHTPMFSDEPMADGDVHGTCAAAYQKGREDMRDEAAILAASLFDGCSLDIRGAGYDISTAIRAIPTDGREGK